eukprot:CAMPEP_0174369080 /NCGR_PEP_ID=MMETSP0811_2-20130205/91262_1 /TAXON_ID=73025 ORGANISM="Eutreptiella gymnastica-like, Strain CCMP1594" /NCGR_SAMPLE_ID=MMETSP0811_2 /ASSEMBLY_ACC=CAM_ASM_000667 /LENGTH=68 /DNA_ID=CAMNT_0015513171 /DNA_START=190 /DNA_END=396 /DNA_ORIENTATION=-
MVHATAKRPLEAKLEQAHAQLQEDQFKGQMNIMKREVEDLEIRQDEVENLAPRIDRIKHRNERRNSKN